MRKSLYIILTLILLLAGCSGNKHRFTLTGDIKGLDDSIALVLIPDTAFARIDTIHIKDNRFTYELKTDTTTQLTILFGKEHRCTVFAEGGVESELKGDAAHWELLTVSGGEANDTLAAFQTAHRNKSLREMQPVVARFIEQHPFSPVSAYLLDQYFVQVPQPDYKAIQENINHMSGRLQDNPLVQNIKDRLELSLNTDTGRYINSFRTRDKDGNYINSYQYSSRYVVMTFWVSWLPEGLKLQRSIYKTKAAVDKEYKDKVVFINASLDTDKTTWKNTQKQDSLPDVQTCDFNGWDSYLIRQFGINNIPQIVILNPQRKVVSRTCQADSITSTLRRLLQADKEKERERATKK